MNYLLIVECTMKFFGKVKRITLTLVKSEAWVVQKLIKSNLVLFGKRMFLPQVYIYVAVKKSVETKSLRCKKLHKYIAVEVIYIKDTNLASIFIYIVNDFACLSLKYREVVLVDFILLHKFDECIDCKCIVLC